MPQPIDPNTEMLRMSAAERIQMIAERASLAAQARTAGEAAQALADAESQIQEMEQKSEQVDEEPRRKNPYIGRRRRRKRQGGGAAPDESHTFYNAAEGAEIAEDPDSHGLDVIV